MPSLRIAAIKQQEEGCVGQQCRAWDVWPFGGRMHERRSRWKVFDVLQVQKVTPVNPANALGAPLCLELRARGLQSKVKRCKCMMPDAGASAWVGLSSCAVTHLLKEPDQVT